MSLSHGDYDSKQHSLAEPEYPVLTNEVTQEGPKRPPIVYSSPGAFITSFGQRWKSVWTRRFALALLFGQIVSLCITCTNVTTTELVNRNWTISTTQTFFLFVPSRSFRRIGASHKV
jgi:solute carrier family 35 protein F1/2